MKRHATMAPGAWILLGLLLGTWNGSLALLEEGRPEPVRVFPCPVSCLPRADQQALSTGIPVENAGRLTQLLEDFVS